MTRRAEIWALSLLDRLRGGRAPGDNLEVYPDDSFVVSYPRSGNTWIRFLIANAISAEPITFATLESAVPDIYLNTERDLRQVSTPRVLKSHGWYQPQYRRVVYVVRDPRDVALSHYHYSRKTWRIPDDMPLTDYVRGFVDGEWNTFGPWGEHVGGWLGAREGDEQFLMVRYEDLIASPAEQLGAILTVLGRSASEERLARSVELSGAERMRKLERDEQRRWRGVNRTRSDIPFIRGAQTGSGRAALPPDSVRLIEEAWGTTMERLGYHPVVAERANRR